jgi:energy-coupling factor transporter ATP-binding protein EcfA2
MRTVYVVGMPGSGKSTLIKNLLDLFGVTDQFTYDHPVPHARYHAAGKDIGVWEVGRRRAAFSGTDALAMNINPKACAWVATLDPHGPRVLLGEGDRLANNRFLDACPNLTLVHLSLPVDVAQARMAERAATLGVPLQNPSWWKGRVTKTMNLIATRPCVSLDATADPLLLAQHLKAALT